MSATSASGNCPERRVTGNGDRRVVSRRGRARVDNRSGVAWRRGVDTLLMKQQLFTPNHTKRG